MRIIGSSHMAIAIVVLLIGITYVPQSAARPSGESYGACIIDGSAEYGINADSAFAMHSVMKFPQALYVADYLMRNGLSLSDSILVEKSQLDHDTWSPMLTTFQGSRRFTFAELLQWSLVQSDNNACDILFAACGSPDKVEAYLRAIGFDNIHIRYTERELRHNPHDAIANCSTPADMARLLEWCYAHRHDNEAITFVYNTMAECRTGANRIAAALPEGYALIHKTGSGFPYPDGTQDRNDVGIILHPDGSHLSIAVFAPRCHTDSAVAAIARRCLMRAQADAFLRKMPADLQQKQTAAILKAIDGDNSDLMAVRNARNTPPDISDNVVARMITSTMRIYEPRQSSEEPLPVLLYLHGGGWTFGSINSCGRFCDAIAASGSVKVVALDYRLAPEHPYPDGLNDCIAAIDYIVDHAHELRIDPHRIAIGGDSSGGNLAIATALSPSCRGTIRSLLLFYPVVKAYDDQSPSWLEYGHGYGLDASIMEAFNRAYTLNADPRDPDISVALRSDADLEQLPPTLIIAAQRDILCDQGKAFAQRIADKAQRIEYPGTVHLFITVPGQDAAFHQAVNDAIAFIRSR